MALIELDSIREFFICAEKTLSDGCIRNISLDSIITFQSRIMHKLRLFKNLDISRVRLIRKIIKIQSSSNLLNSVSPRSIFLLCPLEVGKKQAFTSAPMMENVVRKKDEYKDLLRYAANVITPDGINKAERSAASSKMKTSVLMPRKYKNIDVDAFIEALLAGSATDINEEEVWKLLEDEIGLSTDMYCILEEAVQCIFLSAVVNQHSQQAPSTTNQLSSLDSMTPFVSIMNEVNEEVDKGVTDFIPSITTYTPYMSALERRQEDALYHIYQSYWNGKELETEKELVDLRSMHHSLLSQSTKACEPYSPFTFCALSK